MFSTVKSLFTGRLRIVLGFTILTTFHLISESLLGNIHFTMAILQKCCTVSSKTSTILFALFFWSLYLALMLVVSHVNLLHIHVSTHPENGY